MNRCEDTWFASLTQQVLSVPPQSASTRPHFAVVTTWVSAQFVLPHIVEWCNFHLFVGFDHLYIFESHDYVAMKHALQRHIDRKLVTVLNWTDIQSLGKQAAALQHWTFTYRNTTTWVAHIDGDEWLAPNHWAGRGTVRSLLEWYGARGYCEIQAVRRRFGSNGHQVSSHTNGLGYTRAEDSAQYIKSIVATDALSTTSGFPHCFDIRIDQCARCKRLWWGVLTEWAVDATKISACRCTAPLGASDMYLSKQPMNGTYSTRSPPFFTWSWFKSWKE